MIENSDISEVHGGTRSDLKSWRMKKKRDAFYKLMAKRDDLLTKICRVHFGAKENRKIHSEVVEMKYDVVITARAEGAIGVMGTHRKRYTIETDSRDDVNRLAIEAVYRDGGLEHVKVVSVTALGD